MKHIRNWGDLQDHGINCLTGEACAISARALCDLTEPGAALIRKFIGLPYDTKFNDNWNSRAIGSCFLPWSVLADLSAFILIEGGAPIAYHIENDGVYAPEPGDDEALLKRWEEIHAGQIQRRYTTINSQPRVGCSNVHAMSGRSQ